MFSSIFAGLAAGLASWFAGRLHLRKTQLKALDKSVHLPAGSLEDKANAATEAASILAAQQVAAAAVRTVGKVDPAAQGRDNAGQ